MYIGLLLSFYIPDTSTDSVCVSFHKVGVETKQGF